MVGIDLVLCSSYLPPQLKNTLLGVLQRNMTSLICLLRYINMHIKGYKDIYYETLAHTIMEAENFHVLPFTSWKTYKADGIVSV